MVTDNTTIPQVNSTWLHKNGTLYTVVCVANGNAEASRLEEYPVMISYVPYFSPAGPIYGRLLERWHGSMTLIKIRDGCLLACPKCEGTDIHVGFRGLSLCQSCFHTQPVALFKKKLPNVQP